jgi:hypothetical protein
METLESAVAQMQQFKAGFSCGDPGKSEQDVTFCKLDGIIWLGYRH